MWDVVSTSSLPNGSTQLILGLHENEITEALLPVKFSAKLKITVGTTLEVALTATNTDSKPFTISDALHTYLNISDLGNISIDGLKNASYYDGPASKTTQQQPETLLSIIKEENRRYLNTANDCLIHDKGFGRTIRAAKLGSKVTVVCDGKRISWVENKICDGVISSPTPTVPFDMLQLPVRSAWYCQKAQPCNGVTTVTILERSGLHHWRPRIGRGRQAVPLRPTTLLPSRLYRWS